MRITFSIRMLIISWHTQIILKQLCGSFDMHINHQLPNVCQSQSKRRRQPNAWVNIMSVPFSSRATYLITSTCAHVSYGALGIIIIRIAFASQWRGIVVYGLSPRRRFVHRSRATMRRTSPAVNRMHICVYKCCGTVSSPVEQHDCASERIACTPNTRTLYHNLINMQTTENPRPVHWPVVVFVFVQRVLCNGF